MCLLKVKLLSLLPPLLKHWGIIESDSQAMPIKVGPATLHRQCCAQA
jgi:hypothetical protein